jgi:hypothetical protein
MLSNPTNKPPTPVDLNREIPFVKAVYDVVEGREDIDTVVKILKQAEQAHGLFIHYEEFEGLWGPVLVPKHPPLDVTRMLALVRTDPDKFMEYYEEADDAAYKNFEIKLFNFLDDTHLLLDGSNFAHDCLITLDDGSIWTFAVGEWGEYLAQWAKQNLWMKQAFSDYFDTPRRFYGDVLFKDYQTWADTAIAVIERKCAK